MNAVTLQSVSAAEPYFIVLSNEQIREQTGKAYQMLELQVTIQCSEKLIPAHKYWYILGCRLMMFSPENRIWTNGPKLMLERGGLRWPFYLVPGIKLELIFYELSGAKIIGSYISSYFKHSIWMKDLSSTINALCALLEIEGCEQELSCEQQQLL